MAVRLKIPNYPSINTKALTRLNVDATATNTSITVENVAEFANNDFLYLGNQGGEQTEKCRITAITGQVFTVAAITFDHKRFEGITGVLGDQIRVYRAPNVDGTIPADNTFVLQGSAFNIAPDQITTDYIDTSGSSSYWYKWVFYNSFTTSEVTYLSDMQAVRGGGVSVYVTADEVRDEAGFNNNRYVTDQLILSKIAKACDEINATVFQFYATPFVDPVPETIKNIALQLATGYLLIKEYGAFAKGTEKDGAAKLANAEEDLQDIVNNTIELFDQKGNSLRLIKRVGGWPDSSTYTKGEFDDTGTPTAGGGSVFNISHKF